MSGTPDTLLFAVKFRYLSSQLISFVLGVVLSNLLITFSVPIRW